MKSEVYFPESPHDVSVSHVGTVSPLYTPFHLIELQALRSGHFILRECIRGWAFPEIRPGEEMFQLRVES